MLRLAATLAIALTFAASALAENSAKPTPPVARISPTVLTAHGQQRVDNYYWLRDKTNPAAIAYLKAENKYAADRLSPLKPQIAKLARELRGRIDEADASPVFADKHYVYRRRIAKGASYPLIVRQRPTPGAAEQVVLDVERLAAGHTYYELADYVVSPDSNRVAFTVDLAGARLHRIFIRDIATGQITDTGIKDAGSDLVFSADSKWLFYIRVNSEDIRSYQVWRHQVGSPAAQDQLVFEEADESSELHLYGSSSGKFIMLLSTQQQSAEILYLPAARPLEPLQVLEPRRHGMIYNADHVGETFYVRTNLDAPDFRMMQAPEAAPRSANWTELIPETPGRLIADFELFESFVALVEEANAIQSVRVFRFADRQMIQVPAPAEIGVTDVALAQERANRNAASTVLGLRFSGPLHPRASYDFNVLTGELTLRKRSPAWAWFNPQAYEVKRIAVTSADGEAVPVTLTYRKDQLRAGGNPVLITGYGAYGTSLSPGFPGPWVSLIDRGFIYAQAHVRGGHEKGARWYEDARVLNKQNSFNDFIAATEALTAQGYADPRRVFARGGSAGGLLVAVAATRRPELYAGVVAEVPFVDVVTTMSDPTIPLTTQEYGEWGDPAVKEHHDSMLAYSPYDNVTAKAYPPMLVTAGLHDSQVGFHEPAKWVARLRATKTDRNELLFLTSMNAGHKGTPGRFGNSKENATIMAWLIAKAARSN